jgi:hypothetical protein
MKDLFLLSLLFISFLFSSCTYCKSRKYISYQDKLKIDKQIQLIKELATDCRYGDFIKCYQINPEIENLESMLESNDL